MAMRMEPEEATVEAPQPKPLAEPESPRGGCCQPGGTCGPPIHPRQDLASDGTVAILRVPFSDTGFCSTSAPFSANNMTTCPSQIKQAGVTDGEWNEWVEKLKDQVNALKPARCGFKHWTQNVTVVLTLLLAGPLVCAKRKTTFMAWDAAFREWQRDFNQQVLEPKGIFCKSQSMCWVRRGFRANTTRTHRRCHRWVAFAFGDDAIQRLKSLPHLEGNIENFGCCNGIDENECCMHP